ncbi:MAG: guanitoxin biosynthesis MATE family efflux transporter GntT [Cyanobacteria bacterium J06643_5]
MGSSNLSLKLPARYSSFLPRFYRLGTVSIISNMMVPLAGIVDTAFLGHLADIRYLAGVILASILFDYLYRILKFFRNSTNAITAEAVGQDDDKGIILALLRSALIAGFIGILILVLQYPIQKLGFAILTGSKDIENFGIDYFNARIWGSPAVLLNFVLIGWFLGREKNSLVLLISLVVNFSNIVLDYFTINQWGWGSTGAGFATAISQYLGLLVGLIGVSLSIPWKILPTVIKEVFDKQALKASIALKGNILVRYLAMITAYSIFTNLSAAMGNEIVAENGLLLQIVLLSQFTVNGIGLTTQSLTGNFKGKGETEKMIPLLQISIFTGVLIAFVFASISILFPQIIFGLLTNHKDISESVFVYRDWLLPLLICGAIALMFEGYTVGLKQGNILRNSALIALGLGFIPVAILGWYFQNNHLLWLSLTSYMATLMIALGVQIPRIQSK